jgi:hypothetical protein
MQQRFDAPLVIPRVRLGRWCGRYEVVVSLLTEDGRPSPHGLKGPHCSRGVCVFRGGHDDGFKEFLRNGHKPLKWRAPGQYQSIKATKALQRKLICERYIRLFKGCWKNRLGSTVVELPELRIDPVEETKEVRNVLSRRKEQYEKPDAKRLCVLKPLDDPLCKGASTKYDLMDLSSVRLCFITSLQFGGMTSTTSVIISDTILDSAPRIVGLTLTEVPAEGGGTVTIKVNRDDVGVEFFDKESQPWSIVEHLDPDLEPAPTKVEGPYTAELELEVPKYPKAIGTRQEAFDRLLTLDGLQRSAAQRFHYLPSAAAVAAAVAVGAKGNYLSVALADRPKEMAALKENYEKARSTVRLAVKETRVLELKPVLNNKEFRAAAQRATIDRFFPTK